MPDIDMDGVAECADLLRGAGLTETTDPDLCEATLLLLSAQNKDGSFGDIKYVGVY